MKQIVRKAVRRYVPEDMNLHNYRCENLKSCKQAAICHYDEEGVAGGQEEQQQHLAEKRHLSLALFYMSSVSMLQDRSVMTVAVMEFY
jgi:hypothetical protein